MQHANSCDTLLSGAKLQIANREQKLTEKDIEISALNKAAVIREDIITLKNADIKSLNEDKAKLERHKKWLKLGWLSSSGLFTGFIFYLLLR